MKIFSKDNRFPDQNFLSPKQER